MTATASPVGGVAEDRDRGPQGYRLVQGATSSAQPLVPNSQQSAVIAHRRGPLLVIGGPGTGKTATLVEAVAARVAEGMDPERILVLSFNRRGAQRLREAIAARCAGLVTPPVVSTFHGYAFGLLRRAATRALRPSPRLLTGPEQDQVIRELLAGADPAVHGWPGSLRPALRTRAFASELRDLLLRCAERGIAPRQLAQLGREHGRPEWVAAGSFYREYSRVMALQESSVGASKGYDHAELVSSATELLESDPELLAAERRHWGFVYVDELADTDPAQVTLLATVVAGASALVAFADPDSSVFSFRGSDQGIVADFSEVFPSPPQAQADSPAARVVLTTSYRCGPDLLAATRRVARRLRGPMGHRRLVAGTETDQETKSDAPVLDVRSFGTSVQEAAHVARRLRQAHLVDGVPWSRMAVIVRSTAMHLTGIRRELLRVGIPTQTHAEDLPLHVQPLVAPILLLLSCALEPERLTEQTVVALLHSPLGRADPLAERQLRQGLRARAFAVEDTRPSGVLLVEAVDDPSVLAEVDRSWAAPARAVARALAAARESASRGIQEMLWATWSATGLGDRLADVSASGGHLGEAADRDLDAVVALFDAAARFAGRLPGAGPGVFVEYIGGLDLPADSLAPVADRGPAVRILTAHAAKGLEWDVVAIAGVQEGIWPNLRLRGSILGSEALVDIVAGRVMEPVGRLSALLDEERRLFYVAATRARNRLIITAVSDGDSEGQPSRFLREAAGDLPEIAQEDEDPLLHPGDEEIGQLTLPALVAELRMALLADDVSDGRRAAAADLLADLARQGVRGAAPSQWWGLPRLSDDRPLTDGRGTIVVTPSTVEQVRRCGLRWLLERHGGARAATAEQSIGNLVHAAAMLARDAEVDRAVLASYVAHRFDAIELSARWLATRERERTNTMLDKLIVWLAANPRRLLGIEREFLVRLSGTKIPVVIKGRVDRLERDEQGRTVVVDLKTGRSGPTRSQLSEHGQLAAYQLAVSAGAFGAPRVPGGAMLVQLGSSGATAREQLQRPLDDDSDWARELIEQTAETMASATFEAVANDTCRVCPVRVCCPVVNTG